MSAGLPRLERRNGALSKGGKSKGENGHGPRQITAKSRGGRFAPLPSTAVDVAAPTVPRNDSKGLAPDAGHGTRRLDMSSSLAPSLRSGAHVGRHVATRFSLSDMSLPNVFARQRSYCHTRVVHLQTTYNRMEKHESGAS